MPPQPYPEKPSPFPSDDRNPYADGESPTNEGERVETPATVGKQPMQEDPAPEVNR